MAKKMKIRVNKAEAAERVRTIWPILKRTYPTAAIALKFVNPLELLIATILSAQCTDKRVNIVTKDLFKKYKSAKDWAQADLEQIQEDIRSTGFFRNKATNIKGACTRIIEDFDGKVPDTLEQLVTLPGVGIAGLAAFTRRTRVLADDVVVSHARPVAVAVIDSA